MNNDDPHAVCFFAVAWVGFRLSYMYPEQNKIIESRGANSVTGEDGSFLLPMYALTRTG